MVLVLQWQEMTSVVQTYAIHDGGYFLPLEHKRRIREDLGFQCIMNEKKLLVFLELNVLMRSNFY